MSDSMERDPASRQPWQLPSPGDMPCAKCRKPDLCERRGRCMDAAACEPAPKLSELRGMAEMPAGKTSEDVVADSRAAWSAAPAPAAGCVEPEALRQVQVWCDTCEGAGRCYQESQRGVPGSGGDFPCPDCAAHGFNLRQYADAATVRRQHEQLTAQAALIGQMREALQKALEVGSHLMTASDYERARAALAASEAA